jgi:hypothetical protein
MGQYRIDLIDWRQRACFHARFISGSDDDAIATALRLFPLHHVELWDNVRLVWKTGN